MLRGVDLVAFILGGYCWILGYSLFLDCIVFWWCLQNVDLIDVFNALMLTAHSGYADIRQVWRLESSRWVPGSLGLPVGIGALQLSWRWSDVSSAGRLADERQRCRIKYLSSLRCWLVYLFCFCDSLHGFIGSGLQCWHDDDTWVVFSGSPLVHTWNVFSGSSLFHNWVVFSGSPLVHTWNVFSGAHWLAAGTCFQLADWLAPGTCFLLAIGSHLGCVFW